jgi:hypothetical protein
MDFIPTTQASQTNALKRRTSQMTPVKKFKASGRRLKKISQNNFLY